MSDGEASPTEGGEIAGLQQRLEAARAECSQLQATLEQASAQKTAARNAGTSGIRAAKLQMGRLRTELAASKRWIEARSSPEKKTSEDATAADVGVEATSEEKMRLISLQLAVRENRHELSRFKHQVDLSEAKIPKQEDEIVSLKTELTHVLDIWASTQHAVKHHEVERAFQKKADGATVNRGDNSDPHHVPLHGGGHGTVEASAERIVREGVENRNIKLSGKAKRLSGVVAAQQLLIQRLEKQVLQEEHLLSQKDRQLSHDSHSISQLRNVVRESSDTHIAKLLGKASFGTQRSASAPRLPTI